MSNNPYNGLQQQSSTFLAPETGFVEDNSSMDWGGGVVLGGFKYILFIVHFISIFVTSALSQIIMH